MKVAALIMLMSGAPLTSISIRTDTTYSTMKTLSVKQVSEVLGVSTRAILKRLEKKQLKGTRRPNKFGVEEWWIYPTAEIKEALERAGRIDILGAQEVYADADVLDIDTEWTAPNDDDVDDIESGTIPGGWTDAARSSSQDMAEGVWNNIIGRFLGELKERDQLIGEMRSELADKERQLKLLPDFQKEAEIRRHEAEAKELEAIALAKQIEALKKLEQSRALETERLSKLEGEILPALERQLEVERAEKEKELLEAQTRVSELEATHREIEASKARLEESLQREIERLRIEKEEQTKVIQVQFETLNQKLEKLEQPKLPWYRKLFGAADTVKKNS